MCCSSSYSHTFFVAYLEKSQFLRIFNIFQIFNFTKTFKIMSNCYILNAPNSTVIVEKIRKTAINPLRAFTNALINDQHCTTRMYRTTAQLSRIYIPNHTMTSRMRSISFFLSVSLTNLRPERPPALSSAPASPPALSPHRSATRAAARRRRRAATDRAHAAAPTRSIQCAQPIGRRMQIV